MADHTPMTESMPACCRYSPMDEPAAKLYATYNAAGERKGLNFAGAPCPVWADLPEDVRTKWRAVASLGHQLDLAPTTPRQEP